MPETDPIDPHDVKESHLDAVNRFRHIKHELKCDDLPAAILTLAQSMSMLHVLVEMGDTGYDFDRVGKDIADAIEAVTDEGAIKISVGGELLSSVRGMIDTGAGDARTPVPIAKTKPKLNTKPKRKK